MLQRRIHFIAAPLALLVLSFAIGCGGGGGSSTGGGGGGGGGGAIPATVSTPAGWRVSSTEENLTEFVPGTGTADAFLRAFTGVHANVAATTPMMQTILNNSVNDSPSGTTLVTISEVTRSFNGRSGFLGQYRLRKSGTPDRHILLGSVVSGGLSVLALGACEPPENTQTLQGVEDLLASATFGTFSPDTATAQALVGPWRHSRSDASTAFSKRVSFFSDGTYESRTITIATLTGTTVEDFHSGRFFVIGSKLIFAREGRTALVQGFSRSGNFMTLAGESQALELNGD